MKKKFRLGPLLRYQVSRSLIGDSIQATGLLFGVLLITTIPGQKLITETNYLQTMEVEVSWCLS